MNNRRKEVFFDMYRKTCKYYKQASYLHPCNDCPRCKVCSDSHCTDADTFDPMAGFCAALAKKVYGSTGTVKQIIKASNYEDSQALPFQGESVKDITTRAMAMLLTDVMKGD